MLYGHIIVSHVAKLSYSDGSRGKPHTAHFKENNISELTRKNYLLWELQGGEDFYPKKRWSKLSQNLKFLTSSNNTVPTVLASYNSFGKNTPTTTWSDVIGYIGHSTCYVSDTMVSTYTLLNSQSIYMSRYISFII